MMGKQDGQQELFAYNVNLDERVRETNPLRQIKRVVDFSFIRESVKDCYGYNGNESVDPEVIMKMMFLLFFDNVESERELMKILSERLDYMWFLGYGLDDVIPNHSVLSKARHRWGKEVFEELFVRIVWQCVKARLVGGEKIHVDASLVDANASKDSVLKGSPELIKQLKEIYRKEEGKLEEVDNNEKPYYEAVNKGLVSKTDPDAAIVRKGRKDPRPRYKNHRAVDDMYGVITAVETTSGDVEENAKAIALVEQHDRNTQFRVGTVVGDTQYGTVENMRRFQKRGIRCHVGDMGASQKDTGSLKGIYQEDDFHYDSITDTYTCPSGYMLKKIKNKKNRMAYEYVAKRKDCKDCRLREKCTRAKNGAPRSLRRHYDHEAVQRARAESASDEAKRDRKRRTWLMEGSYADAANNHGFKQSRWRRLHNQQIQDYLIAAIQNIRILIRRTPTMSPTIETQISLEDSLFNNFALLRDIDITAIDTRIIEISLCYFDLIPSVN